MRDTKIKPTQVALTPQLIAQLARWSRLDGQMMVTEDKQAWEVLNADRLRVADMVARGLLKLVETGAVIGDLAAALVERDHDYAAYHLKQEKQTTVEN